MSKSMPLKSVIYIPLWNIREDFWAWRSNLRWRLSSTFLLTISHTSCAEPDGWQETRLLHKLCMMDHVFMARYICSDRKYGGKLWEVDMYLYTKHNHSEKGT